MKSNSTVHCQAECNGSSIPIHRTAEGYLIRYRDGKHRRSRVFEKSTQAVEFAKFLARRLFWSQFAAKHAPCLATPPSGAFPLCPATRASSAVELSTRCNHGFVTARGVAPRRNPAGSAGQLPGGDADGSGRSVAGRRPTASAGHTHFASPASSHLGSLPRLALPTTIGPRSSGDSVHQRLVLRAGGSTVCRMSR